MVRRAGEQRAELEPQAPEFDAARRSTEGATTRREIDTTRSPLSHVMLRACGQVPRLSASRRARRRLSVRAPEKHVHGVVWFERVALTNELCAAPGAPTTDILFSVYLVGKRL